MSAKTDLSSQPKEATSDKLFGPDEDGGLRVSPSILDTPGYRRQIEGARKLAQMADERKETTAETAARMNAAMTAETDLLPLLALLDIATPGPWRWSMNGNIVPDPYTDDCEIAAVYSEHMDDVGVPANAAAIIGAVNFLRTHGANLAELQREVEALRAERDEAQKQWRLHGSQMDAFAAALQKVSPWSESNDMLWIDEVLTGLHFLVERATTAEARAERLAEAGRRVTAAFRAHGKSDWMDRNSTRDECEAAMLALDAALEQETTNG